MKKLFFAAAMLMSSLCGFAQQEVGTVTIQPKAGFNVTSVTDLDGMDKTSRVGLAAGAEVEYQLNEWLGLSAGAIYSMQGVKADAVNLTVKLDYINVPILANFYVCKGLALKTGIQPAFNVNSRYKMSISGISVSGDLSDVIGDDIKSFDFSIPVGISYEYKNFVIDGRYNVGVTKLLNDSDSKNSVFQFTLGYKFSL